MAKKRHITLDELAGMMKRGFDEMAKKSDMDTRFDEVEETIKQEVARLEKELAALREDMAFVNKLPAGLERRVTHCEDDIRLIKTKVGMR